MKEKSVNTIYGYISGCWRYRVGWIWIPLLVLLFSCGNEANQNEAGHVTALNASQSFFAKSAVVSNKAVDGFIASEPSISNFRQVMANIHSLKTLKGIKSKQLILFAPEDAAFDKLDKEEKEKLLAPASLTQRHALFKNSLILHNRSDGEWNGIGKTYGKQSIRLNAQTGIVSFKNHQARILKQITVEGGHLIYIVDTILT